MKFVLGFAIGISLGILFAPAPGVEVRSRLSQRIRELSNFPEKKAAEFAEAAKERAGELGSRVGRQAAEAAVEAVREDVLGRNKAG